MLCAAVIPNLGYPRYEAWFPSREVGADVEDES